MRSRTLGQSVLVSLLGLGLTGGQSAGTHCASHDPVKERAVRHESHGLEASGSPHTEIEAEERTYSLFMHRTAGMGVITLSVLSLMDRLTGRRFKALRKGMGLVWLLLGTHILVNADPTHWPIRAGFVESFSKRGSGEWMQHKILSLVPITIGIYAVLSSPQSHTQPSQLAMLVGLMVLGGLGLLFHEHEHNPDRESRLIETQHQVMATTGLFSAAGAILDGLEGCTGRLKPFLLPVGLILLGLELVLYTE